MMNGFHNTVKEANAYGVVSLKTANAFYKIPDWVLPLQERVQSILFVFYFKALYDIIAGI